MDVKCNLLSTPFARGQFSEFFFKDYVKNQMPASLVSGCTALGATIRDVIATVPSGTVNKTWQGVEQIRDSVRATHVSLVEVE
jgi:hypothetical protein